MRFRTWLPAAVLLVGIANSASAQFYNTNDTTVVANTFAAGGTVVDFEAVAGLLPHPLVSYAGAYGATAIPASAQLSNQIPGLHFHSGGGSFNDPAGTPGTPVALLSLQDGISGDAHSASNVVGPLEINTENLHLAQFIEIIFTGGNVDRAGVWLNPSLGPVFFTAFDSTGQSLDSGAGVAGNFVGVVRPTADIRFISIVSTSADGFTADDLTFGASTPTAPVPEPGALAALLTGTGTVGSLLLRRRTRK